MTKNKAEWLGAYLNTYPYHLSRFKYDLHGPKGNVFNILGAARSIITQMEGEKEWKKFHNEALEERNVLDVLSKKEKNGICVDYNTVITRIKKKTGITFISTNGEIPGVDSDLYEIENSEFVYL